MCNLNLELYKKLYLIRKSEETIIRYYPENGMKTPMHMSMGGEAIAVGVCQALDPGDHLLCSYRSHSLYLAKSGKTENFFAEMYGKGTALQKGKAGSMHLCDPETGFMGASAIVGSHIPVAVGVAYANKMHKNGKVAVAFFGDGAIDEGVFWESINAACLMKLPIMFVCEDNGFAVHNPAAQRHGYDSISDIVSKFKCDVLSDDSTDVEKLYNLAAQARENIIKNQRPCFLHLKYYRYLEHVGINPDFEAGYRSRDEFEKWAQRDPVKIQREKLLKLGQGKEVLKIEGGINAEVGNAVKAAKLAPFADVSELYTDIFAGGESINICIETNTMKSEAVR